MSHTTTIWTERVHTNILALAGRRTSRNAAVVVLRGAIRAAIASVVSADDGLAKAAGGGLPIVVVCVCCSPYMRVFSAVTNTINQCIRAPAKHRRRACLLHTHTHTHTHTCTNTRVWLVL